MASVASSSSKPSADILTQLSNVLPTSTFLALQMLAPLATNNGICGATERSMTGITLFVLSAFCCLSCFTDSYRAENGTVYCGVVTSRGLWNPNLKHAITAGGGQLAGVSGSTYTGGGTKYQLEFADVVNATLSVIALAIASLFTAPVSTCFWPKLPNSISKTVPLLAGMVVSGFCAFGTSTRHGIGFMIAHHAHLQSANSADQSGDPSRHSVSCIMQNDQHPHMQIDTLMKV